MPSDCSVTMCHYPRGSKIYMSTFVQVKLELVFLLIFFHTKLIRRQPLYLQVLAPSLLTKRS